MSTPAALCEAGLNHIRAGRYLDAQTCCQQALAIDSNHADTLYLMGLLSFQAKQYDLAVEWIARAIRQNPQPKFLLTLGAALWQSGRREEALKAYEKAAQINPENADLWKNLGDALVEAGRPADALLSFQQALKLDPHRWDVMQNSAIILHRLGRLEEALSCFNLCDALQPNHVPTLSIRAMCLYGLKRFAEALTDTRRAQALDPTNAEPCNNIGILLRSHGRDEEALEWFDRALVLRPNFPDALHNKAVAFTQTRRFHDAFAIYDGLKAADPNDAVAHLGSAHLHMLTGNFEAGWAGREARWKVPPLSTTYPKFLQPLWLGDGAIEGKTILVAADEGFGDTIQFARYLPMLAERGARVVFVVQDALRLLLSDLPGVSHCIATSTMNTSAVNALPAFDIHCPMMSLPLAFGTRLDTIPSPASYLPRPAESRVQAWEERLGRHDKLRVGLVWSGNPNHANDHNRSLPLRALAPLFDVDATFVSLQKDPRPADKATLLERADIIDLTAHLTDFTETAALVSCLDLVITVDTSVAHLAAALGCPTWILLPYTPDYRWLLDRDDSPWYPDARLFRQTKTRDYGEAVGRARDALLPLAFAQ
ncbi:tetratricopeptide repeat-containing glycosyltransferase family protein [Bradyrhizobium sp. dw_411]|uniref:tetratricopeptide repeat-containing glycosyltransferase family protein n=1 Tax=Bradyrhizobium sp. dw_411 TaxID=2720082 RepID=UPI0031FF0F8A